MHFAYIGNINDLHYLCSLHVLRVKDVFRKFSDVGDGRLARKHALNYKLQVEFANSWNGLRMDCGMEVVGGLGESRRRRKHCSASRARVRRRRQVDRFLIALPDSISEGEEGRRQDGPVS